MSKTFSAKRSHQFVLDFGNGNRMSCIWGPMTYSDNHDFDFMAGSIAASARDMSHLEESTSILTVYKDDMQSNTVEILYTCEDAATIKKIEKRLGDSNPLGYVVLKDFIWLVNLLSK